MTIIDVEDVLEACHIPTAFSAYALESPALFKDEYTQRQFMAITY